MKLTVSFFSQALQKSEDVALFFDEAIFSVPDQELQVVYLLHGYQGEASNWEHKTKIEELVTNKPVIGVALSGDNSFYLGNVMGFNYETFILEEIDHYLNQLFPTFKLHKNIAGLSMGGYGALRLALKYPGRFESVGIFSTVADIEELAKTQRLPQINLAQLIQDNSDADLFKMIAATNQFPTKIMQYCGLNDPYLEMNKKLYQALSDQDAPVVFYQNPGTHDWQFWNNCLQDFLALLNFFERRRA